MLSLDMHDISGGSSYWENGQFQSVAVNPAYGKGFLSATTTLSNGITIFIQNFSLYGRKNIQLWSEEKMPMIAFSSILSGVCELSYRTPRTAVGNGISHIESGIQACCGCKNTSQHPGQDICGLHAPCRI